MNFRNFLHDFGFDSLHEILEATIGYKHHISTLWILGTVFGAGAAALKSWIDLYIYNPALGMIVLWSSSILDVILGLSVSVSKKEGVDPNKLLRAGVRVIVQTLIVTLFYHMGRAWPFFIYHWMVDGLLALFTLSVFYSAIQNAYKLGFISEDAYRGIQSIVNIKKLVDYLKNKK